jgi:hypothetical protein
VTPRARILSYLAWVVMVGSVLAGSARHDVVAGSLACVAGWVLVACGLRLDPVRIPRGMRPFTMVFGLFFVVAGAVIAATA